MEIRQLKAFVAVAKLYSFTRAAELLDYAQSSITAQVGSLEDELSTKLFERLGRQVVLTKDGEKLLPYAEQILKLTSEAKELVSSSAVPRGALSVGAVETLCSVNICSSFTNRIIQLLSVKKANEREHCKKAGFCNGYYYRPMVLSFS
ncbi:LysR family transcriptional regulator [Desulfoscipio gibsoniae]|uniref:Transcriptional regulator n=1 Tax=Desulfoscipio gibsoniae DSM 7213 TaxID=767817 RepID=R4KDR1_9FIRM|nr:LysR family transcriptional regulator [Desulfoscipio gibsoniae]AGK99821.1 transcriptional regulator [Desulfoscipio gibsoniae DSM 7213]